MSRASVARAQMRDSDRRQAIVELLCTLEHVLWSADHDGADPKWVTSKIRETMTEFEAAINRTRLAAIAEGREDEAKLWRLQR